MTFQRPSPQQIRNRLAAEIEATFDGADARLRRAPETVITRATAIASHELHGHIEWVASQILPDTADADILDRHASVWGVTRRAALEALGAVAVTGAPGTTLPAGSELRRADDARYSTDADVTIGVGGTITAAVTALNAGASGNAPTGSKLSLIAPVIGIQAQMTVIAPGLTGGVDLETDTSLRRRILARIQEPPHGGAAADYAQWVKDVIGDTLVWITPFLMGIGSIGVTFVMPDGSMPTVTDIGRVQAQIDMERPVTAQAIVYAPIADLVPFTIKLSPDTTAIRAAVTAELTDMILREAVPGGTLPRSRLNAAISAAAGEYSHVLMVPAGDIVSATGHIARLGAITWSA